MVEIDNFLKGAMASNHGVQIQSDDVLIVDYINEFHGKKILKAFDQRAENLGVVLFFHNQDDYKDLVMIMRLKHFRNEDGNGLIMFYIKNVFENARAKEELIDMMKASFKDDSKLREEIISAIDVHMIKSIEFNA